MPPAPKFPGRAASFAFAALSFAWVQAAELPAIRHPVAGLARDVEILVDRWGVPHIYAQTTYDAFFAQGFNAARDRLWQIDLWRKRGLGELARDFGPAWVDHDRAARLFLFRGDMHAEWLAYASDTKRIVENFVAGINAWATNSPGQSGDPRSPHYRDLFDDWAHDKYFPLLFDRPAVEKSAAQRIVLVAIP